MIDCLPQRISSHEPVLRGRIANEQFTYSAGLNQFLQRNPAGCLDSQSVRTTEEEAPATRGCDWHKRVKGRKRHLLVDTLGLLLAVAVTTANMQDKEGAVLMLSGRGGAGKKLRRVCADGAYRTEHGHLATWLERHRIDLRRLLASPVRR